jgi:hypothetical protein
MESIQILQAELEQLQDQNKITEGEYIKLMRELQDLYEDLKMIPELNEIRLTRQIMKYYTFLLHLFMLIVCFFLVLDIYFTKMNGCEKK